MPIVGKEKDFEERRNTSQAAKLAMVERLRSMPGQDSDAARKRAEERRVIAENRAIRANDRKNAKLAAIALEEKEAQERAEAERAAEIEKQAELEAEKAARAAAELSLAARVVADEAARKAARDAKYAARKARKS